MGTIVPRRRKNGTTGYLAKISIMQQGKVHRENKTFDRKPAAAAWIARREEELRAPGALDRAAVPAVTLAEAIGRYEREADRAMGKTKRQVLSALRRHEIAAMQCADIASADIVSLATDLRADKDASTVGNYLSHLSAIFAIAGPAWSYPLDRRAMEDAQIVARRLGLVSRSRQRNRRPTLDELDRIMQHFGEVRARRPSSNPMQHITAFALFSTRRQDEILRITWADLDERHARVLVRDMKNPGEKIGNDVWCDLPPEALAIVKAMPRRADRIFPFSGDAVSAAFTRATRFLAVDDLRFHDLRHEGISRLFEMGWNIPHVASVSGHRSWTSLKRYTHIRESGDKYAGWKWMEMVTKNPGA